MLLEVNYRVLTRRATVTPYCITDLPSRSSVKSLFRMFMKNHNGACYFPDEEEARLLVSRISLDLRNVKSVSLDAMDELFCEAERVGCPIKIIRAKREIHAVYDAARRSYYRIKTK